MRRLLCLLFLAAVGGTAAPARADNLADEADLRFRLGAEAYQRGDYKGALEQFLTSNRLVPNRNVTYNVARCYEELKAFAEAYRYFTLALTEETETAARTRIERALASLRQNVAVLEVESEPPGATVFVDRRDLGPRGNAPLALGLKPGAYVVLVELSGYHPARREVPAIGAGQSRRLTVRLEPILGRVRIAETARGAAVRVDDAAAPVSCTAPCELALAEGRHRLYLERPGYGPSELEVSVDRSRAVHLRPELAPLTGSLVVSTDEPGALVELDGQPRGFTPLVLSAPVGPHRLQVSLGGFKSVARDVLVADGRQTRVDVALTQAEEVTAASRSTENVDDAPSSVSIISRRELAALRYPTISEALRGVPGVYGWNDRSYQALGFRGLGRLGGYGNTVLVLVDGHPMNDNWLGSSYVGYDARVGLEDVERIEVVRGPGSVLYGTNAFSGVINLVTRKPTQRGGELGLSTVESGVARGRVRANVPLGPDASLWTSAAIARSSGRNFYFPELGQSARDADGFEAGTVEGRYQRRWLSAAWFLQTHHKRLPTGEYDSVVGDPRTAQTDSRGSFELRAEPSWGETVRTLTRLHANHYRFDGSFGRLPEDGGLERDTFRGNWVGLEQRVELQPSSVFKLTVGGEGQVHFRVQQRARDESGSFLDDSRPFQVGAAYALLDVRPSDRVHVSAGARLDAYSTFGRSLNPRLAVVGKPYAAGNTKLMFGKAFRAPSVYELYYNDGGFTQVQSPDVGPESIYSVEAEHAHRFSPTISGSASLFCNYAKDLITTAGEGVERSPLRYENAAVPIATVGGELGVRRDFRQGYMLGLSYSFQRSRFLQSEAWGALFGFEQSSEFRRVANSPEHLASFKGALPLLGRALTLATRLSFESGRFDRNERVTSDTQSRTDAFAIWDVVLTGREERYGFSWAAGLYNAFDWRYSLPVSAEFRQRTIMQDGRTVLLSGELVF
ncbi:MAG: TonB-dependent receptor [Polyangiaceae bacterium]|jgi:outer membrane receptor for ferrienterochelin and colicin|nr:TonB-dependent receptor [Polyangiaceae bacterium]